MLELLASQAAISLENARLYSDLQEREAKVRRLVDSNIIGICIWDARRSDHRGQRKPFSHGGVRPRRSRLGSAALDGADAAPNGATLTNRAIAELKASGTCQPCEKEYFRKDGSRVPVLVGAATFGEKQDQGVAFVLDLTERKRTEARASTPGVIRLSRSLPISWRIADLKEGRII